MSDYWVSAKAKLEALRSTRLGAKPDYLAPGVLFAATM